MNMTVRFDASADEDIPRHDGSPPRRAMSKDKFDQSALASAVPPSSNKEKSWSSPPRTTRTKRKVKQSPVPSDSSGEVQLCDLRSTSAPVADVESQEQSAGRGVPSGGGSPSGGRGVSSSHDGWPCWIACKVSRFFEWTGFLCLLACSATTTFSLWLPAADEALVVWNSVLDGYFVLDVVLYVVLYCYYASFVLDSGESWTWKLCAILCGALPVEIFWLLVGKDAGCYRKAKFFLKLFNLGRLVRLGGATNFKNPWFGTGIREWQAWRVLLLSALILTLYFWNCVAMLIWDDPKNGCGWLERAHLEDGPIREQLHWSAVYVVGKVVMMDERYPWGNIRLDSKGDCIIHTGDNWKNEEWGRLHHAFAKIALHTVFLGPFSVLCRKFLIPAATEKFREIVEWLRTLGLDVPDRPNNPPE